MSEQKTFSLSFSAFMPPLAEQLAEQGIKADGMEHFERARTSIAYLSLHGFLTESAGLAASKKLMKAITAKARPLAPAPPLEETL